MEEERNININFRFGKILGGYSIGSFVALFLSWGLNHAFAYALIHFFLGWFYIIYLMLARSNEVDIFLNKILL